MEMIDRKELAQLVATGICANEEFTDVVREKVLRILSSKQDEAIRIGVSRYIDEAVAKVDEHLKTAKFQRTNQWGEPQGGQPLSLAEWVDAEIARRASDRYSSKDLLSAMMASVNTQISKHIDVIFAEQRDAIKKGIADIVAKRIVDYSIKG